MNTCLGSLEFTAETLTPKKPKFSAVHLQMLQRQNRLMEHKEIVDKIKQEYKSLHKACGHINVPYKTLHSLCKPLQKKKKMVRETCVNICHFYEKEIVSHELPSARLKGCRFMTTTLEHCYNLYREDCTKESKVPVSFSTFARLRPKNVFKIDQTPDRQCICDDCENFHLLRRTLNCLGVKGVPAHSKECMEMSLCKQNDDSNAKCSSVTGDNNADGNVNTWTTRDAYHQIDPNYGGIEYINSAQSLSSLFAGPE